MGCGAQGESPKGPRGRTEALQATGAAHAIRRHVAPLRRPRLLRAGVMWLDATGVLNPCITARNRIRGLAREYR